MRTKINCFLFLGRILGSGPFFRENFMRTLTFLTLALCYLSCNRQTDDISTKVYATQNGFGYDLEIRGKTAIRQITIPAIAGNAAFCDSLDAVKVSDLVKRKLSRRENPSVSKREIDSLKIRTKC